MPIPPSLVVYNAALSACAEATEWQHALQQLRDLGSKLKNLSVVSQHFFLHVFLFNVGIRMHGTFILLDVPIFNTWA